MEGKERGFSNKMEFNLNLILSAVWLGLAFYAWSGASFICVLIGVQHVELYFGQQSAKKDKILIDALFNDNFIKGELITDFSNILEPFISSDNIEDMMEKYQENLNAAWSRFYEVYPPGGEKND